MSNEKKRAKKKSIWIMGKLGKKKRENGENGR